MEEERRVEEWRREIRRKKRGDKEKWSGERRRGRYKRVNGGIEEGGDVCLMWSLESDWTSQGGRGLSGMPEGMLGYGYPLSLPAFSLWF